MIPAGTPLGGMQVQLGNAPTIGKVDPDGRLIHLGKLEGWAEPASAVRSLDQRAGEHGALPGLGYYGPRVVVAEARIDGWSPSDSYQTAQRIVRELDPDRYASFSVTDEVETLGTSVLQDGKPLVVRQGNRTVVSLSLLAPDPRRYTLPQTVSTGLPSGSTGGLSLPLVLPLSLNATQATGTVTVENVGDLESRPSFVVYGPCAPFTITDAAGRQLIYPDSVDAGRRVVLDGGLRTARLDGTALRYVTGRWPVLAPGTNRFSFNATTFNADARMEITYRSARR